MSHDTTSDRTVQATFDAPWGRLLVEAGDDGLRRVSLVPEADALSVDDLSADAPSADAPSADAPSADDERPAAGHLRAALEQLGEYVAGTRTRFELTLAPCGTAFQRAVWSALQDIPHGQTRSYGEIASQVGNPSASRAVGMANHANPFAVVVPCHRVVGADGRLTGYAGGLDVKRRLLAHEGAAVAESAPLFA